MNEIKKLDLETGFNIREEVFRVNVCRIKVDEWNLIISNHHIMYDGWSNSIIIKEFLDAYDCLFQKSLHG